MNQLISNVLMQPNQNAVERPMTLVEKLDQEKSEAKDTLADISKYQHYRDLEVMQGGKIAGLEIAIEIVKQHQSWRKMPSYEKPQDMQAYNLLLKNNSAEYPTLYSVGLFRQCESGHVWLSLVEAETYIDESKILAWQPMNMPSDEFFESLKQPPSEVQDD